MLAENLRDASEKPHVKLTSLKNENKIILSKFLRCVNWLIFCRENQR